MKNIKNGPRFMITFVAMIFIPMFFMGTIVTDSTEQLIANYVLQHLETIAAIQETRITQVIERSFKRAEFILNQTNLPENFTHYNEKGDLTSEGYNRLKVMMHYLLQLSDFETVSIVDMQGMVAVSTNHVLEKRDFPAAEIFIEGKNGRCLDILTDASHQRKIFIASPFVAEGRLRGVLVIEARTDVLIGIVTAFTGLGNTGETVLAKRNFLGDAEFITPRRFEHDPAAQPSIKSDQTHVSITQALLGREERFKDMVDYRGRRVLAATRYLEAMDWGLAVKMDYDEAFAPIKNLKRVAVVFGMITFVFILLISFLIARSISHPIERLVHASREIISGRLDTVIDPGVKRLDNEIGELAQSLDTMTRNLIDANTDLERRVHDRTAELRQYTQELERFNRLAVGREERMIELKKEINALSKALGREPVYNIVMEDRTAGSNSS